MLADHLPEANLVVSLEFSESVPGYRACQLRHARKMPTQKLISQTLITWHFLHLESTKSFPEAEQVFFTSRISGRGNRISPVCLSVCLGLWDLCCAPHREYRTLLCNRHCAPPTYIVHHGAQGGPKLQVGHTLWVCTLLNTGGVSTLRRFYFLITPPLVNRNSCTCHDVNFKWCILFGGLWPMPIIFTNIRYSRKPKCHLWSHPGPHRVQAFLFTRGTDTDTIINKLKQTGQVWSIYKE